MNDKITSLSVQNYKGVREITLHPEGSLVVIAGGNGAGKSSFIDAITEIFDPSGTRLTPKPIRAGETEASAEVVTSTARVVRTWKKDDAGTLAAYALDGAKYPSGKDFILKATGGALFDPKQFVNLSEKDQRDQLLARVELPFDLAQLDADRKAAFDGRTDATRELKRVTAVVNALPTPNPDAPAEEVSAAAILADAEAARTNNARVQQLRDAAIAAEQAKEAAEAEVARLAEALDSARAFGVRAEETRVETLAAARAGRMVDLDAITAKLTTVEETNAEVRKAKARAEAAGVQAKAAEQEATLTAKIDAFDKTKREGLAAAKFPVDGLSVDDTGITFNGIPFRQVNTAMKTRVAFDLATLPQPDLRLIVIKDGDSLDGDSLAEIGRIADERGYIVLVERDRDESRQIGFTVVDGAVSA
jgi:ABC-type cobalamin/Fe3+-siderophores transport system ATPase subunit